MISPLLKTSSNVTAVRGEGSRLYDAEGRSYLDFTAGIGVTSTGHCHPRVVEAIRHQAGQLLHGQYTTVRHRRLVELSARLAEVTPAGIETFFYASAGTEVVEAAMRLSRHADGRRNLIVFQGGFHGRTMGSLSLTTSKTPLRRGLQPMLPGIHVAPFPYAFRYGWDEAQTVDFCLRELDYLFAQNVDPADVGAMFIEPVLGEGGYVPVPTDFLIGLRQRCDEHGILLVVDEIQSGVGRTGRMWALEHSAVRPDILITAKGLASGMPLSAFGASKELMSRGILGSQGGTYGGNAVACAAALATLEVVETEGLVDNARDRGEQLLTGLAEIASAHDWVGELRGLGLMIALEMVDDQGQPCGDTAHRFLKEAEKRGMLLLRCGPFGQVVRIIPPLVVTARDVEQGIDILAETARAVAEAL